MVLIGAAVAFSQAQEGFRYPPPPAGSLQISRDVQYGATGDVRLLMDVYRPAGTPTAAPALIFFNTATGADRKNAFYAGWAQTAADKGLVGIVPDLRSGMQAEDFHALVRHLTARAADYGIDREALASMPVPATFHGLSHRRGRQRNGYQGRGDVLRHCRCRRVPSAIYRCSTSERARSPTGESPDRRVGGAGDHPERAGDPPESSIRPSCVRDGGRRRATRDVIERTLDFVNRATSSAYQSAMRQGLAEADGCRLRADWELCSGVSQYAHLVRCTPRCAIAAGVRGSLAWQSTVRDGLSEFDKLRDKGLGYRDLGLPAARACMQHGDADAAIAWLRSIPQRVLSQQIFGPIRSLPRSRGDLISQPSFSGSRTGHSETRSRHIALLLTRHLRRDICRLTTCRLKNKTFRTGPSTC